MKQRIIATALLALFAFLINNPVQAQAPATVKLCNGTQPNCPLVGSGNPLPVTGSFSATLSGFAPAGTFASLTSAGTSGSVALPAGTVVAFQNTGTTTVSCTLGIGSATALANELQVPASSTVFVTVGSNTFGACIDQTGSTSNTVVLAGGTGLGTGFGGGGGGGGGGGTVTQGPTGTNAAAWWTQIGDTTNGPAAIVTAGANGASNTASGLLSYGRNLVFNGTTWDRWTGAVTLASGAVASGAYAAGSLAAGAGVDGWDVPEGHTTDTACPASGTATMVGCARTIAQAASTPLNNSSVPINISTATTTQLVALSGSTAIYVTSFDVIAGGTGNITFEYGTGSNCGTGTTVLTGAYPLVAQAGISKGDGIGTVLKVPSGNALCVLTSAGVQMSGSVSFQQF